MKNFDFFINVMILEKVVRAYPNGTMIMFEKNPKKTGKKSNLFKEFFVKKIK